MDSTRNINEFKKMLDEEFNFTEEAEGVTEILVEMAGKNDCVQSMVMLGMTYYLSSEEDAYKKSLYWFEKAAERGSEVAATTLGNMYMNGYGVEVDFNKAIKYHEEAANKNYAPSEFLLGQIYETGRGVDVDLIKAANLYLRAANQGFTEAMVALAILKMGGRGCELSFTEAKAWLEKAAKEGNEFAGHILSDVFHGKTTTH